MLLSRIEYLRCCLLIRVTVKINAIGVVKENVKGAEIEKAVAESEVLIEGIQEDILILQVAIRGKIVVKEEKIDTAIGIEIGTVDDIELRPPDEVNMRGILAVDPNRHIRKRH